MAVLLVKTLLTVAQLSYAISGTSCATKPASCVAGKDETSLLQVDNLVHRRVGRQHDLPFQDPLKEDVEYSKVYFRFCEQRSPFCDMRLNLKDQLTYEIEWVLAYLDKFGQESELEPGIVTKFGAPDAFLAFGIQFKDKLKDLNKREGTTDGTCAYLRTHEEFKAHLKTENIQLQLDQPGKLGQLYANWQSNPWVNLKKASDAITDADAQHPNLEVCSWTEGQEAWGDDPNELKKMIRTGFMWDDTKGRGTVEDRLSMTSGAPRDILNYISADAWVAEYDELKNNADLSKDNHASSLLRKAALPGVERWAMTFKNRRLGFFAYGDTPPFISEALQTKDYFFEQIVHGFGIHGRNTIPGNPADRFRYVGMPWIGGVSGSVVDFYIAAKKFGFSGKILTDMVMSDVAFLAAAGQHSVSELVFACTSIFLEGPQAFEAKMSEADEEWKKEPDYDKQEHPFKIDSWRQLVTIMNKQGDEWNMTEAGGDHDLPALFTMAMREFMKLSNHGWMARAASMEHTLTANLGKLEGKVDSGSECLKEPGLEYFKKGLENRGGIDSAFKTWTSKGAPEKNDFGLAFDGEQRGLTEAQFIELISGEGGFGRTSTTEIEAIIANIEDTRIRSLLDLKTDDPLEVFAKDLAGVSQEDLEKAKKQSNPKEAVMKLVVKNLATSDTSKEKIDAFLMNDDDGLPEAAIAAKKLLESTLDPDTDGISAFYWTAWESKDFSLTVAWQDTITKKLNNLYKCLIAKQATSSLTKDGISAFYWTAWENDQPSSGHGTKWSASWKRTIGLHRLLGHVRSKN